MSSDVELGRKFELAIRLALPLRVEHDARPERDPDMWEDGGWMVALFPPRVVWRDGELVDDRPEGATNAVTDVGHCPGCGHARRLVWGVPVCVYVGCDHHAGTTPASAGPVDDLELCTVAGCQNATVYGVCSHCRTRDREPAKA